MITTKRRRLRFRPIAKWATTLVCALLILGYAASFMWQFSFCPDPSFDTGLLGGAFAIIVGDFAQAPKKLFHVGPYDWNWQPGLEPRIELLGKVTLGATTRHMYLITIPVWIPFLIFAIPAAWLWYLDTRRPKPGKCQCGYDLTGNASGRCPECGHVTTAE